MVIWWPVVSEMLHLNLLQSDHFSSFFQVTINNVLKMCLFNFFILTPFGRSFSPGNARTLKLKTGIWWLVVCGIFLPKIIKIC